jgi:hypothetical protein
MTDYFISPKQKIEELEHERTALLARIGGLTTWQRKQDKRITALETALKAAKEQRADDIARVWRIYKM